MHGLKLFLLFIFLIGMMTLVDAAPASNLFHKKIFIGVDGLSRQYFDYAQKDLNLFKEFKVGTHVAPFPSMSDYSWNQVVRSREVFGKKGRIGSYEAARYSETQGLVVDDGREYFRRLAEAHHYFEGAFDFYFNPYMEALMYLPTKKLAKFEFNSLRDSILSSGKTPLTSVMIASIDAISHTQENLIQTLIDFDQFLKELKAGLLKLGINSELILVSDHGQSFRFRPGEKVIPLKVVDIDKAIEDSGFNLVNALERPNDIAMPVMALGNYVSLFFKDRGRIPDLIDSLKGNEWLQHCLYVEKVENGKRFVKIHSREGVAELIITNPYLSRKITMEYIPLQGNPLEVEKKYFFVELGPETSRRASGNSKFPDALYRIAESVLGREADFPDMIVTLEDDYRIKGDLDRYTQMYRTHGSLSRNSSSGIVATDNHNRNFPDELRSENILGHFNIKPRDLFYKNEGKGFLSTKSRTEKIMSLANYQGPETGRDSFKSDRIFGVINKMVQFSKYVLDAPSLSSILDTFKGGREKIVGGNFSISDFDFSSVEKIEILTLSDIGKLIDIILENPDLDSIQKNRDFIELKRKVLKKMRRLSKDRSLDIEHGSHREHKLKKNSFDPQQILSLINNETPKTLGGLPEIFIDIEGNKNTKNFENLVEVRKNEENRFIENLFSKNRPHLKRPFSNTQISPALTRVRELISKDDLEIKKGGFGEAYRPETEAAKTMLMKSYGLIPLIEKSLNLPEFKYLEERRSLKVVRKWDRLISSHQRSLFINPETQGKHSQLFKDLFENIFNERQMVEDNYPTQIPLLYNGKMNSDDVTIVFIPGIYSSIFNGEIFTIGIDALRHKFGTRVIVPKVLSACSSKYNAKFILKAIQDDMDYLSARIRAPQKYFIFGYSKGAVDALHFLSQNQQFSKENILGLLSIASPLQGASILEKTDLPISVLELLSQEKIPNQCVQEERAAFSVTPDGMNRFYRKNKPDLLGLTKYYSISFVSNVKDAHIWMKATKQIAKFDGPNDGVVSLPASKFPEEFKATDLGVVKGDHLAGVVASLFPQASFFEALFLTLNEMDAFNKNMTRKWRELVSYNSSLTTPEKHMSAARKIFSDLLLNKNIDLLKNLVLAKLKGTPYESIDFSFKRKRGVLYAVYTEALFDVGFLSFWTSEIDVEIKTIDDLAEFIISKAQKNGRNLTEQSKEIWRTYPDSSRKSFLLPRNTLSYYNDFRISLRKLAVYMDGKEIDPITPETHPSGILIIFDHKRLIDFRREYQFNYEDSTPVAADDNDSNGWNPTLVKNRETGKEELMAKLSSRGTSSRLTSYSMRFKPADFPKMSLDLQVNNDVKGADVLFGGSGKDDSAFQVWFTLRELAPGQDRSRFSEDGNPKIFGHYWGDQISGVSLRSGEVYENYYSKKNYLVAVLPEAKQLLLEYGSENLGKRKLYKRNLLVDLKAAYPNMDTDNIEIIGITFQHDSNDTEGDSEALFKSLKFEAVD